MNHICQGRQRCNIDVRLQQVASFMNGIAGVYDQGTICGDMLAYPG
jgi:hypothetical protein